MARGGVRWGWRGAARGGSADCADDGVRVCVGGGGETIVQKQGVGDSWYAGDSMVGEESRCCGPLFPAVSRCIPCPIAITPAVLHVLSPFMPNPTPSHADPVVYSGGGTGGRQCCRADHRLHQPHLQRCGAQGQGGGGGRKEGVWRQAVLSGRSSAPSAASSEVGGPGERGGGGREEGRGPSARGLSAM